jgi:hypothetical protein
MALSKPGEQPLARTDFHHHLSQLGNLHMAAQQAALHTAASGRQQSTQSDDEEENGELFDQ